MRIDFDELHTELFEALEVAVAITDYGGNLLYINQRYADLIGYEKSEVLKLSYWDVTPEKYMAKEEEQLVSIKDKGAYGPYVKEYIHKLGHLVPVKLNGKIIKIQGEDLLWSTVEDITNPKELEKKLKVTNEYLDLALKGAGLGIWDWDLRDNSVRFDRRWVEMIGLKFDETPMELSTWESRVHEDDLEGAYADIKNYMEGKTDSYQNIHRMRHADGSWVFILDKGRFSDWDNDGNPIRFTGTHLDVTQLKVQELQLQDALKDAKNAEKVKSDFLANMSHEIRTPMNGIIGVIELLKDSNLNAEQAKLLETMELSGNSLLRIINDVLDLSKIEAGKVDFEIVPFNFDDQIKKCIDLFKNEASKKNLELRATTPKEEIPKVEGDYGRINQILINLISNAIKFTESGSIDVNVSFKNTSAGSLLFVVDVRDTGVGFPQEVRKKLFENFQQADSSITRKYGGTGLGLSISSKLAKLMGGKISADSEIGIGSVFSFSVTLPIAKNSKISLNQKSSKFENQSHKYPHKILIVEDNPINQKVITKVLSKLGYECDVAEHGKEALELIERNDNTFTLIFMDMQMPIMDGIETTKAILKIYGVEAKPIVAMTANAFHEDREKCFEAGMSDFIAKPIQVEKLKEILKKFSVNGSKSNLD